jgi:hypothetical protein
VPAFGRAQTIVAVPTAPSIRRNTERRANGPANLLMTFGRTARRNLVFSQSASLNERLFRQLSRGINHDLVSRMDYADLRRAT